MLTKLVMDTKRYALLLNSVARQGTGQSKRPLTPIECAESIKRLIEEGDTYEQVAERLGLGKPSDKASMYKKTRYYNGHVLFEVAGSFTQEPRSDRMGN